MSDKIWRVGIIGAGSIVQWSHYPNFAHAIESTEIVAICDVQKERVEQFARQHGIPQAYTDYEAMLGKEDLDIVVVAVPNAFHKPMSLAALKAGAHVLCEKPVALTLADAQEMFAVAAENQRVLTVGTHYRWSASMRASRNAVDEGFFGEIYHIRSVYTRRAGIPGFGSWFTRHELAGGGCGLDIGIHALDKALYLMDYPEPATVSGVTSSRLGAQGVGLGGWGIDRQALGQGGQFDVEDLAYGLVRFKNGSSLILQSTWAMHLPDQQLMEIYGTEGGAIVHYDALELYRDLHGAPVTIDVELTPAFPRAQPVNSALEQTKDLIRHLEGDANADVVSGTQAMVGIAILEGLYQSAAQGQEVAL